jgi:hypothetical protein
MDGLVRDKDMGGLIIRINCYGDDHLSCETVWEKHLERAVEGWHTWRYYLAVKFVKSSLSEDCARSRSDGARYFTALAGARGEVRWGQARVRHPLRDNSSLSVFLTSSLPLSDLEVGCDAALSAFIAGTWHNVPQIWRHAVWCGQLWQFVACMQASWNSMHWMKLE